MPTPRRRAARERAPFRGRARVALGLVAFLLVTSSVVWRRSTGVRTGNLILRLQDERQALLAQEKVLESQLRRATSRRTVVAEAERRLGMARPSEAQTRFLPVPAAGRREALVPDSAGVP